MKATSRHLNATIFLVMIFLSFEIFAKEADVALVYKGPGVCVEDCAKAAAIPAEKIGLKIKYVGPDESDPHMFDNAAVWIQPGGGSLSAGRAMTKQLKENIRAFISRGGGFVGFCAGAPLAAAKIHDSNVEGLGILPGIKVQKYLETGNEKPAILKIQWNGISRFLYWEAGSYMVLDKNFQGDVIAYYPNKSIAALRLPYDKGRVFISGLHPEAPDFWKKLSKLSDPDGTDIAFAEEMVRWSAGSKR